MERFRTMGRDYKTPIGEKRRRLPYRNHLLTLAGLLLGAGIIITLLPDDAEAIRNAELLTHEGESSTVTAEDGLAELTEPTLPELNPAPASAELTSAEPREEAAASSAAHTAADGWIRAEVRKGDSLSTIFQRSGFSSRELYELMAIGGETKALTRIHPGAEVRLLPDAEGRLLALSYQIDELRTLKVTRGEDGFRAAMEERELDVRVASAFGTIQDSLFLSAARAGLSDRLIMEMVRIFGWDIDFALDIRQNDRFAVIYEELFVDGRKLRDGRILAAEFENRGRLYRAVGHADASGRTEYYTPEGKSLRKAFLRTPVEYSRVSSRFNPGRLHPVLNRIRAHKGVDYAAPTGTPIRATGDGRIVLRGQHGGYGNTVIIQHGSRYSTLYAHMSRFASGLKQGDRVRQGQIIGYVGSSGLATGPHLHYEFRIDGQHHDPLTVKLPDADPLPRQQMADFLAKSSPLLAQLDNMRATMVAVSEDKTVDAR